VNVGEATGPAGGAGSGRPGAGSATPRSRLAEPFLAAAAVLWAGSFIGARRVGGPEGFDAEAVLVGRTAIAAIAFVPAALRGRICMLSRRDLPPIIVLVFTGHAGYLLLFHLGAAGATAATASLIINLSPVIGVVAAALWLRDHLSGRQWAGVGLALGGSIPVSLADGGGLRLSSSVLWLLAAAVAAGIFVVAGKPVVDRMGAMSATAWGWWLSVPVAAPFIGRFAGQLGHAEPIAIWSLIYLGVGSSFLAYIAWSIGLSRARASTASAWLFSVPVLAVFGAWALLGERPGGLTLAGGGVALVGVWLASSNNAPPAVPVAD